MPAESLPGLEARRLAQRLIDGVLLKGRALEDGLEAEDAGGRIARMEARDRGFARLMAATVLRRHGSLSAVLSSFIERPLPIVAARARTILLLGAAQVLLLGTPAHAAINLAVEQCRRDPEARRFDKLANAVLRRVATNGAAVMAGLDWPSIDVPPWLWARWLAAYGDDPVASVSARRIAAASLAEAPLDVVVKDQGTARDWTSRLGGRLLATGSIRLTEHGRIEELPGYSDGAWWIQDAAAALPARLLAEVRDLKIADLCAAPGGKTAALAAAGAQVTAVDVSASRQIRMHTNLQRLGLNSVVETVTADILQWSPAEPFDAVLLDAPCTSTGTIRRHPDLMHLKRPEDAARLAGLQAAMLKRAAGFVKPGGTLIFCTCSLEPEEGALQIASFLASSPQFVRRPIMAAEIDAEQDWLTVDGDLRTLPCHTPRALTLETPAAELNTAPSAADKSDPLIIKPAAPIGGMDGFYAARLVKCDRY